MDTIQFPASIASAADSSTTPITVAHGDGVGPEIMDATLRILTAAGARIAVERIEIGESVYLQGHSSGIRDDAWESLRRTKVLLKAPITTPQGGGYKSLNVTLRKSLGLFANVRPCRTFDPFIPAQIHGVDVVIVRENEEDLYAGIEHRQTQDVVQCLKLITRPGSERVIRYAFEFARRMGRRKVTCMSKDNIMKLTDGLFHRVFNEVAAEYPEIAADHMIIDIGIARAATRPRDFDVIVTPNLYGDILSDVVAEVTGSVGMAPSANVGAGCAMFEAIHGSAPDIAGKDIANPSGLLRSAVMMLAHIGQADVAERVQNAWLKTIEDGVHTRDIASSEHTRREVGTREFADAVIDRLGQVPNNFSAASFSDAPAIQIEVPTPKVETKLLVGVDVFIDSREKADDLALNLQKAAGEEFSLEMITNRGIKVWPNGLPETVCVDHWRCRFKAASAIDGRDVAALLSSIADKGLDAIKTENLYTFDDVAGYSKGQGQ